VSPIPTVDLVMRTRLRAGESPGSPSSKRLKILERSKLQSSPQSGTFNLAPRRAESCGRMDGRFDIVNRRVDSTVVVSHGSERRQTIAMGIVFKTDR
jgi:hypothetical protein